MPGTDLLKKIVLKRSHRCFEGAVLLALEPSICFGREGCASQEEHLETLSWRLNFLETDVLVQLIGVLDAVSQNVGKTASLRSRFADSFGSPAVRAPDFLVALPESFPERDALSIG